MTRKDYDERDAVLRSLGFHTYADYLTSELWQNLRARVLRQNDHTCFRCGKTAWQIHHLRYTKNNLLGKSTGELWPVCDRCHRFFHSAAAQSPLT